MGKISWQTTFPHSTLVGFVLSFACFLTLKCYMSMDLSLLHLPLAALSLALPWAPQLGSGKTKKKKRKQEQLETSEGWTNTSCSQVWLGNKKPADGGMWGGESNLCSPCQSTRGCFSHPTDGSCSWNNVIN